MLRADAEDLPAWAEGLSLEGVHAFGRAWNVRVMDGSAVVEELGRHDAPAASPRL